jgi:stage V sporulation protein B
MAVMATQRLRGKVAANVGLTILALVFAGLVPFGFNLLVGRAYGPAMLGGISVVLGLALFLGQVPSTVGIAATKFMAEALGRGDEPAARAVFRFLFTLNLGLSGLLAAAMNVAAPWIRQALHVPVHAVLLASVLLLVYSLYLFLKSVYYGIQRVSSYVWNEIVSDVAFFVLLAAVFAFRATPWLLLPFVLNNAIFAAIAVYQLRPYFRDFAWVSLASQGETLRYSVVNGLGSAASLGRTLLGTTVAGLFLAHHAVGLYAAAVALTSPLQLMPRALALVLFATMARLHGAGRASSVRELLELSTEWLVLVLGILCGLLIINATAILAALFRSEYVHATIATQLVVFGSYLLMISSPAISALSSTTHVRIPTAAAVLGLGTSLALWLLLIPRLGIDGAALGFAAGSVITGGIPVYFAYRLVGTNGVRFLRLGVILGVLVVVLLIMGRVPLVASAVFVGAIALLYVRQVPSRFALVRSVVTSRRDWRGLPPTPDAAFPATTYPSRGQPRGQGNREDPSSAVVPFTLDAVRVLRLEISEVQGRGEASVTDDTSRCSRVRRTRGDG